MKKQINNKKIATASMAVLGIGLIVGGAFAALSDTLNHNETITIEWVDIVDGSAANLALEDVSDATNTPVNELTPGITYELTGTLENDSTVITDWVATDLTTTPGMTVTIADADGADTPSAIGEDIDVSQFGITVQVDQSIAPTTPLDFMIEFNASDARVMLAEPTVISTVFPDPAMAACVANDDESGANGDINYLISQDDLNGFNDIDCENMGITSIEGIQYMTNITYIELSLNEITDLTPLTNLINLEYLHLANNEISDITPIENLVNVTSLSLGGNNINDIDSIANLENLVDLDLAHNQITDVTDLANLDNLIHLDVLGNQISDFSPLTYKPNSLWATYQTIDLPNTTLGTPTDIIIDGVNGEDLIITWVTPGTYENGELTWENPGVNSLTYTSADGSITGTITQTVN